jgi:hypothetical protein
MIDSLLKYGKILDEKNGTIWSSAKSLV